MTHLRLETHPDGQRLILHGEWRLAHLAALDQAVAALRLDPAQPLILDGAALTGLDSAGAMLLVEASKRAGLTWSGVALEGFEAKHQSMLALVAERCVLCRLTPEPHRSLLHRFGALMVRTLHKARTYLAFFGQTVDGLGRLAAHPRRFRHKEFFVQLEGVGLESIPIVVLMTFLTGMVFAYLLGIQVEKYGANIFIVDGVSLALARELAPMLTAILLAGRSGAAFTAQIGAMRVAEEVDAITTLGLSPIQVLVLPRLLAIVIAMPLLTFLGDVTGLLGSALVAAQQLDITLYTFFYRLNSVLGVQHVLYGLAKAPFFAAAIALIACRNGFAVSRDARSVGEHTTATVVTSLVAVILINAAFAVGEQMTP
ncbi:MAG: MlaE family lipid ABC transporter permease subunit [Betaproteobacteria bacterium]|nr:MlaE family lipid ABC transporter permease subunit [Betaproteobacteria bacterium]